MNLEIRQVKFSELHNDTNFYPLLDEYGEEGRIDGLPPVKAKMELYELYEKLNSIYIIAAYFDGKLIGVASVLSPISAHFSALVCVCESLFVSKEFRKTGAGVKLIRKCEEYARNLGAPGLLISAPIGGSLDKVLGAHKEYKETNRVFFRKFNCE